MLWLCFLVMVVAGQAAPIDAILACVSGTSYCVLPSGSFQLAGASFLTGNLSVIGSTMNASTLQLSPSNPLVISSESSLSFSYVTMRGAAIAVVDPTMPGAFYPIRGFSVEANGSLVIAHSTIVIGCMDWDNLFTMFCDQGYAPGSIKVSLLQTLHLTQFKQRMVISVNLIMHACRPLAPC